MLGKNIFVKGQSLVDIVTVFAIISLVVIAMQTYIKRGIQGRTKDLTDMIINPNNLAQRYTTSDWEKSSSSSEFDGTTTVSTVKGGGVIKNINETTGSTSTSESLNKP